MKNITAVVGENNAGKTAVLRALNSVLNYNSEEFNFINKRHQFAARTNTYITIKFCDIPNKEVYEDKKFGSELTLQFIYTYSENRKKYFVLKG